MKRIFFLLAILLLLPATAGAMVPTKQTEVHSRIVGGSIAPEGSWPSQVLFRPAGAYLCGGTLVDDRWILTAAHCADAPGATARNSRVVLGSKSLSAAGQRLSGMFIHPRYDRYSKANDIALLRLREASDLPTARMLRPEERYLLHNSPAYVAGWGTTCYLDCDISSRLQEATVSIFADQRCLDAYGDDYIPGNMVCAGGGGKDSCQGDSGGPLEIDGPSGRVLVGVVSWGVGCGWERYPGVYGDVSYAFGWIEGLLSRSVFAPETVAVQKRAQFSFQNTDTEYRLVPRFKTSSNLRLTSSCKSGLPVGETCTVTVVRKSGNSGKISIQNRARETLATIQTTR